MKILMSLNSAQCDELLVLCEVYVNFPCVPGVGRRHVSMSSDTISRDLTCHFVLPCSSEER